MHLLTTIILFLALLFTLFVIQDMINDIKGLKNLSEWSTPLGRLLFIFLWSLFYYLNK